MRFESPWTFVLLLLLPVLLYWGHTRKQRAALRFSSVHLLQAAGISPRQRLLSLLPALRVAALVFLVIALARPQQGQERVHDVSQGIAIEMVVDRSGSMRAPMRFGGQERTRLDVVKSVFEEFVHGDGDNLEGRPNDLVGLVSFARYADTICPLTLGHDALSQFMKKIDLVQQKSEDGTAIGDALALAAARLRTAEQTLEQQHKIDPDAYELKSRIIILLTDGCNNVGKREPLEAAAMAKEWGIKIYTIGVGELEGQQTISTFMGPIALPGAPALDEKTLSALAKETGGIYRHAADAKALRAVYEEINQLEKSEIESVRYLDYREYFTPFALAALLCLLVEVVLRNTLFRSIP